MNSLFLLEEFIKEALLDEAKKKKSKKKNSGKDDKKYPGNPNYYKGLTDAEKKIMAREVRKCSKKDKPKSCYNYPWPAEKRIEKKKKKSK